MKIKYLLAASAVSLTAAATFAAPAAAQEVTSSVQGVVTTEAGEPVGGASVTITDTRTGRTSTVTTSSSGGFTFRSLEVGGPFTVSANAAGYQGERVEGIFATLGDTTSLRFELADTNEAMDEIIVSATAIVTTPRALGPGSSYDLQVLQSQPSATRDIRDIIQTDPRVLLDSTFPDSASNRGTVSCLGASTRVNSLTVDGVRQDDGFGLNDSGFPSESQPFPFEALSSVSVEFAPFDVQYGLFSGCNINAVTKSGTNEFSGGAFFYYNDDSLVGDTVNGRDVTIASFDNKKYGAYLGGPIIKDKLFFHLTYDKEEGSEGVDTGPAGSGLGRIAEDVTLDEIAQVQQIMQDVYGFDAGDFLPSIPRETERILARIDANLSDTQRVAFNYQRTRENFVTTQNLDDRDSEIGLSSNWYQSGNKIDSYSLRLFSDWSDNFSTEVRVSRIENSDQQDSLNGVDFQEFEITTPSGGVIFVGPDEFRQANDLRTTTDQVKVAGFLTAGNHNFTIGAEYDRFDVFNLFIQSGNGVAEFDSFADLIAQTPTAFRVRAPVSGDRDDATAIFEREIYSFYIQDEWLATPDLTLQFGLRYDFYNGSVNPAQNPTFLQRYGFTNQTGYDNLDALQPRFGFRYDAGETFAGNTTFRGGVGIFSGGDPSVIFSNSYTNNGVTLDDVDEDDLADAGIPLVTNGFSLPTGTEGLLVAGDGEVNAIDPNFNIPTFLRANLGLDHEFNNGWRFMVDYLYSKSYDPLFVQDLTLAQTGTAPDGRPLYRQVDFLDPDCATTPGDSDELSPTFCASRPTSDYLLTNGKGGRGHVISTSLSNRWSQEAGPLGIGGSVLLAYSFQDVTEIQPLTSSRAVSNFGNFSKADVNNPLASTANASRKHNAVFRLNLEKDIFGDNETQFTFFLKYRTGQPFSYNYETSSFPCSDPDAGRNPFGDSRCFEDRVLLYVPTLNDPNVVFASPDVEADFNAFVADFGLEEFRGQILDRNQFRSSDYWDLDLRFTQELPGFFDRDRFRLILDVENALNLIDSSWNTLEQIGFEYNLPVVDTTINDAGQYVYERVRSPNTERFSTFPSVWQIQVGITYDF
ncbi:TonB-dependent receptor [Altererythrobacter lutimaris]|uniref:TonB-dependent receptor n=1 Tax=Altererythrobacter lutimaris TaxID=2743979 RepID=A0A850HDZ5_9SPHN|nr:TonB-dependent receptor [Altererythrobacter lutimaris]NVE95665.1 TonB-dependent receptor [Altererythrobacter lutimaris]